MELPVFLSILYLIALPTPVVPQCPSAKSLARTMLLLSRPIQKFRESGAEYEEVQELSYYFSNLQPTFYGQLAWQCVYFVKDSSMFISNHRINPATGLRDFPPDHLDDLLLIAKTPVNPSNPRDHFDEVALKKTGDLYATGVDNSVPPRAWTFMYHGNGDEGGVAIDLLQAWNEIDPFNLGHIERCGELVWALRQSVARKIMDMTETYGIVYQPPSLYPGITRAKIVKGTIREAIEDMGPPAWGALGNMLFIERDDGSYDSQFINWNNYFLFPDGAPRLKYEGPEWKRYNAMSAKAAEDVLPYRGLCPGPPDEPLGRVAGSQSGQDRAE